MSQQRNLNQHQHCTIINPFNKNVPSFAELYVLKLWKNRSANNQLGLFWNFFDRKYKKGHNNCLGMQKNQQHMKKFHSNVRFTLNAINPTNLTVSNFGSKKYSKSETQIAYCRYSILVTSICMIVNSSYVSTS